MQGLRDRRTGSRPLQTDRAAQIKRPDQNCSRRSAVLFRCSSGLGLLRLLFLDLLLDAGIDVVDRRLLAHLGRLLLSLAHDQRVHDRGLHGVESGRRLAATVLQLDDVPAEVGLDRLRHLAFLHLEDGGVELGHHLAFGEIAEQAALVLGARVGGVLLGELCEVAPGHDLGAQLFGLLLAVDQDVACGRLVFGLHAGDARVVYLLGLVLGDGGLEGLLEVLLPEQALPQVVHLLLELRRRAELFGVGGLGEERVVDQVLGQRAALDFRGEIAELAAKLTFGELQVRLGDRLAIDFRHNLVTRLFLGADRLHGAGKEREGNDCDGRDDAPGREH
jgi:hypothetical protein